jgi:hypothetical protein
MTGPADPPAAPGPRPPRVPRPLPRADRLTAGYRFRLLARRVRGRVACLFGRHAWVRRRNPDVGGPQAVWMQCRRCGREDSPSDPRQMWF